MTAAEIDRLRGEHDLDAGAEAQHALVRVLTVCVFRMRSSAQASPAAPSCVSKAWAMAETKSSLSRRAALHLGQT